MLFHKPLKPREPILEIEESDDEDDLESEQEDEVIEGLISTNFFNTNYCIKNQLNL